MLAVAPIIALLLCPALWLVLGRPRFLREKTPREKPARISVIIPARDEEDNLPKLLDSLLAGKTQPHEIIVVDDGSTDATAAVAEERGAKVVAPAPLPDDWKGKPWACQTGAEAATGDWLLFMDADTWFEPGGYEFIPPLAHEDCAVSSICPYHHIQSPTEELSAFFNLIMVAGSNAFGLPASSRNNSALFGQCLLISAKTYQQIDGHKKVRNQILENFHLAEHLHQVGIARNCYLGRGVITMRMFSGGLPNLWQSWKKGFTSGAKQAHPRALVLISLWLTAGMTILVSLLVAIFTPSASPLFLGLTAVAYSIFALQCGWAFRQVGRFSPLSALFFPVGLIFYQALFFTALWEKKRGTQTNWKGRDVS
ncbi:glycosyltransferase [Roseibacillus persicicus]|uniref:glycosyltransferase n=1 Tax=Roseibacillus persicicus TaxID=454148 RepID=UPI00280CD101|nr:glycosyltransferase [Roseibacillus persicicus]MDQ8191889.1 glycosyltransferase [Roseibacillus persicicus]